MLDHKLRKFRMMEGACLGQTDREVVGAVLDHELGEPEMAAATCFAKATVEVATASRNDVALMYDRVWRFGTDAKRWF